MNIIDKLKFKWHFAKHARFRTHETGHGRKGERYFFFRDQVRVRYSRFGYVEGTGFETRESYLATCADPAWKIFK